RGAARRAGGWGGGGRGGPEGEGCRQGQGGEEAEEACQGAQGREETRGEGGEEACPEEAGGEGEAGKEAREGGEEEVAARRDAPVIRLVTLDPYDPKVVDRLCKVLYTAFGVGCEHAGDMSLPPGQHEPFDAQELMKALPSPRAYADDKVLYLTSR